MNINFYKYTIQISRKAYLYIKKTLPLCLLFSFTLNSNGQEHLRKPNIVFILVDDLGLNDLGVTGSLFYETPHIDRMAREGTIFTQGYACSAVCSPSRASIFTGKFTARHGITDWIGAKSGEAWREQKRYNKLLPASYVQELPKEDISLAEALKSNGYSTFFAGKWHLGSEGSYPQDHGFEINKGGWEVGSPIGGYFSPWKNPSLPNIEPGENLSMRLAKETSSFIEENKNVPFFAFLSFYAVHGPIETTREKWQKYRAKAEKNGVAPLGYEMEADLPIRVVQDNPIYAGLVEAMDDAVGNVMETLRRLKLDQNTLIIFTSDNGGVSSGDAFSTSNLPLRGGKGYQWEAGMREPYFIKIPWLKDKPKTIATPVTGADFYPTILDLVGLDLLPNQHLDGESLKPLFEGKKIKNRPLYWHYPHYGNQGGQPNSIIRENNFKLIHYWEDGHDELYDLAKDPYEKRNLSTSKKAVAVKLHQKLMNFLESTQAKIPIPDPTYSQELANKRLEQNKEVLLPKLEKQRLEFLKIDFRPNETWWDSQLTKD